MDIKTKETARKQASIRNKNIRLIINLFRKQADSTFSVGKALKLSSGGAKKLVDDIAAGGIITRIPATESEAKQGRPPIKYGINPAYCKIVVVNYAANRVSLFDFGGTVIDAFSFAINGSVSDADVYGLADRVEEMLARHKEGGPLAAIAIAYLGRVDPATHGRILSGVFADCNVNIYEYYKTRFKTEIILRNDLQFAILAERQTGMITGGETSCCYMQIGNGVACAMLINDKPYLGAQGIAGEIGQNSLIHTASPMHVEKCLDCAGLTEVLKKDMAEGKQTALPAGFAFADVVRAYESGDELVRARVAETARCAGLLVKNTIEFMDFDTIILSGAMLRFGAAYTDTIRETVRQSKYRTRIAVSELAENGTFLGAFEAARDLIVDRFAADRVAGAAGGGRTDRTAEKTHISESVASDNIGRNLTASMT